MIKSEKTPLIAKLEIERTELLKEALTTTRERTIEIANRLGEIRRESYKLRQESAKLLRES